MESCKVVRAPGRREEENPCSLWSRRLCERDRSLGALALRPACEEADGAGVKAEREAGLGERAEFEELGSLDSEADERASHR